MNLYSKKIITTILKDKTVFIKKITPLFFIIGLLLSSKLWISERNFPTVPIIDNMVTLPGHYDKPIFIAVLLVLTILIFSHRRIFYYLLFLMFGYLLITDQMRWQPWVYIYLLFLVPFTFYSKNNSRLIANYFRLILIGIYIWSGFHKLNPNFNELIVESFTVHLLKISDTSVISLIKSSGSLFAIMEILGGILLMLPNTRKIGVYLICGIHLFIILYISPIGINYNYIVLPWNVFMVLVVTLVFYNSNEQLFLFSAKKKEILLNTIALIVITLPILNFFNLWDSYLSFSLYSGKINNYYVIFKNDYKHNDAYDYQHYYILQDQIEGGHILDIDQWAMNELNVPMIPQDRVFKKVARYFCSEQEKEFVFFSTKLPFWKLMYFDYYKSSMPHQFIENYNDELFFLKLKIPIKNSQVDSFECAEL